MSLDPKPRGLIKVSQVNYNSAKNKHNTSTFSVSAATSMPDWWKNTAKAFNTNVVFLCQNSQMDAYYYPEPDEDPPPAHYDENLKNSDYRLIELEYNNQYAYLCGDGLDYTKITDAQFFILKKLIMDNFSTQYIYNGTLPNGSPSVTNVKMVVDSMSYSLPPANLRRSFNFATSFNQMMTTAILKKASDDASQVTITGVLQITASTLVMPPFGDGNDFDLCSNIMGNALQTSITSVVCTPMMAATRSDESIGSVTWLGANSFNANHAAITVDL